MGTFENFTDGLLAGVFLMIGFIFLFVNVWIGLFMMMIGLYLKYKSDHYVHT